MRRRDCRLSIVGFSKESFDVSEESIIRDRDLICQQARRKPRLFSWTKTKSFHGFTQCSFVFHQERLVEGTQPRLI